MSITRTSCMGKCILNNNLVAFRTLFYGSLRVFDVDY